MSQSKEPFDEQKPKKGEKGFSTALLLNLSPRHTSILDLNEGIDNIRLNTSASAIQADLSSIMNNCISSDLMNKIENLSPIKSKKTPITKKISDICLVNCEEGKNLNNAENICSDDNSFQLSCDFELNEEIIEPNNKKTEEKSETPQFQSVNQVALIEENKDDKENININEKKKNQHDKKEGENENEGEIAKKREKEKFNLSWSKNSAQHENMFKNNINNVSMSSNMNSSQLLSYYNSTSKYFSHTFAEEKEKQNENKLHDSLNTSHNYIRKPISPHKNDREYNNQTNYFNKEIPFNTKEYQYENYFENYSNQETPINSNTNIMGNQINQPKLHTLNQYQPLNLQQQPMRNLNESFPFNNIIEPFMRNKPINPHQPSLNYQQSQQQYQQQQQQKNQYYAYMMMQQLNNNNQFLNQEIQQEQYANFSLPQFQQQSLSLNQRKTRKLKKSGKKKGKKKSEEGSDNEDDYLLEMFGRRGWICSQCNNFNYESNHKY